MVESGLSSIETLSNNIGEICLGEKLLLYSADVIVSINVCRPRPYLKFSQMPLIRRLYIKSSSQESSLLVGFRVMSESGWVKLG